VAKTGVEMAKKNAPRSPKIKYAIEIKIPKRGAKGNKLIEKISSAIDQALKQVPLEVLESSETIVISTNSEENGI
jgi:hypothetical protein